MRNIEVKARLPDRAEVERRLAALGARREWTRRQTDTFFAVPRGWLKVREVEGRPAEIIAYRRAADPAGPRPSDYDVVPAADGAAAKRLLSRVLAVAGVVAKERTLWMSGHTRIHLDRVEGLGDFIELETAVEGITAGAAAGEARSLAAALGIAPADVVPVPYLEVLRGRR